MAKLYKEIEVKPNVPVQARQESCGRMEAVGSSWRCPRIKGFMLRYGRRYSGKSSWTAQHMNYLSIQKFAHAGQQIAFEELINAALDPASRIERLTQALEKRSNSGIACRWLKRSCPSVDLP